MRNIFDRLNVTTHASLLIAVLATFFAAGCSDILKVELPGRIPTDLLGDPITAPTLAASVVADFECAFSNYVASTSILSDQFLGASGNLSAKNWGTRRFSLLRAYAPPTQSCMIKNGQEQAATLYPPVRITSLSDALSLLPP